MSLITTADVINYYNLINDRKKDQDLQNSLIRIKNTIDVEERNRLNSGTYYPLKKLNKLSDNIYKLDVNKLKQLVRENFYDPSVMKEIFNVMNSIAYLQPNTPGAVNPNERVKEWLKNLQKIGSESVEGIAFKADLRSSNSAFVIKGPKSADHDLLHEFIVGMELNDLRAYVPNFAYVFGGFKCTPSILKEILPSGTGLNGLPLNSGKSESVPVSWCDNSNINTVQYIILENISPGVSMKEYVSKCTFEQFLDKYLQVLYAILALQSTKNGSHNDLHYENVIIKEIGEKELTIPYTNEFGNIDYLKTDAISTIIDYGFTHLKLKDGVKVGIVGAEAYGVFYDKFIPLHDAYKLLMFCMMGMLNQKNFTCYQKTIRLYRFFNQEEDPARAINSQSKYIFMTPYNEKTASVKFSDFMDYIRKNVPEFSSIVTTTPTTKHVLGCTGNDVCMTSNGVIKILGFDSKKIIDNIFDFYDIVSRLNQENRLDDIKEILNTVDPNQLLNDGINKYNESVTKIQEYFNKGEIVTMTLKGLDLNLLTVDSVRNNYKNFLIEVAEVNESFERLALIYDCLILLSQYFDYLNIDDIKQNYLIMVDYYSDFLVVLDSIKDDAKMLGHNLIQQLQLQELDILSKNIP